MKIIKYVFAAVAVVAMALKEYLDDTHDVESGTITIIPKFTKWTRI